ncbi:DinB family protein [Poritiphilus flavus]|uniref:DinB family protein n=1 Tax=Poritiphilus flavus TaxID=2697053 RepID=A0A6L9E7V3_9FLAO|nr:DinB family protein [Poritiphilus flavus]NAS10724.1 DinB family protein [Poritiphilus flavus]
MNRSQLKKTEYDPYYWRYICKVPETADLIAAFTQGGIDMANFFKKIPAASTDFRYAADKWSIKEVLQHLIDTERIFMYRCFRIARKDSTPLAGFDQNIYIAPSGASSKSWEALLEEYEIQRRSSVSLLNSLDEDQLAFVGMANDNAMSARAAAFTVAGHEIWHKEIVEERYLK